MKCLVFDSSTLISIATNNLLWVIERLKNIYDGEFYITPIVKNELINYPISTKKFKLEAVQILSLISRGILKVYENPIIEEESKEIFYLTNNMISSEGKPIQLLQDGEIEAMIAASKLNADLFLIDERTTRVIMEDPKKLASLIGKKTQKSVTLNEDMVVRFSKKIKKIKIARSIELLLVAFDLGILDEYTSNIKGFDNNIKKELIDGLLWGLRLRGCSISQKEIDEVLVLYKDKFR